MDEACHPIQQPISEIDVYLSDEGATFFRVGKNGVTRIEACFKPGLHANIPYVRVWSGAIAVAEFCQHNIVGLYFKEPEPTSPTFTACSGEADPECPEKDKHVDNKECPNCWIPF